MNNECFSFFLLVVADLIGVVNALSGVMSDKFDELLLQAMANLKGMDLR